MFRHGPMHDLRMLHCHMVCQIYIYIYIGCTRRNVAAMLQTLQQEKNKTSSCMCNLDLTLTF